MSLIGVSLKPSNTIVWCVILEGCVLNWGLHDAERRQPLEQLIHVEVFFSSQNLGASITDHKYYITDHKYYITDHKYYITDHRIFPNTQHVITDHRIFPNTQHEDVKEGQTFFCSRKKILFLFQVKISSLKGGETLFLYQVQHSSQKRKRNFFLKVKLSYHELKWRKNIYQNLHEIFSMWK